MRQKERNSSFTMTYHNFETVSAHNFQACTRRGSIVSESRGGGTWVLRGVHTFVIKIKKYPKSTDFWPKKHPYFNKTLIFSTK